MERLFFKNRLISKTIIEMEKNVENESYSKANFTYDMQTSER